MGKANFETSPPLLGKATGRRPLVGNGGGGRLYFLMTSDIPGLRPSNFSASRAFTSKVFKSN